MNLRSPRARNSYDDLASNPSVPALERRLGRRRCREREAPSPFTHREMAFIEARSQAFLIAAEDARRYDEAFGTQHVMDAVVFLVDPSHLLRSFRETPYLYAWNGSAYEREKELAYVTRENLTAVTVQKRLRGELGASLLPAPVPAPTASARDAGSQPNTSMPYATIANYDAESERAPPAADAARQRYRDPHPGGCIARGRIGSFKPMADFNWNWPKKIESSPH